VEIVDCHQETFMIDDTEITVTPPPMHSGEMLREDFIEPLGLSAGKVARACRVPRTRIERIVSERLGISGDTATSARFLGTSREFWMNLQARYEALMAEREAAKDLAKIIPFAQRVV
jgi:antitoxin HigA-1